AHVDDAQPSRLRAGQDRRDVAAAQREQMGHAVAGQNVCNDVSAMGHGAQHRAPPPGVGRARPRYVARVQCRRVPNLASAPDAEQASNLILYAIPAFVIAVVAEALWARRHRDDPEIRGYELRDSAASMTMGLLNVVVEGFTKLLSIPFFA